MEKDGQQIHPSFKRIYTNATFTIQLNYNSKIIEIKRGIRQGDLLSFKLLTLAREDIFKQLQ